MLAQWMNHIGQSGRSSARHYWKASVMWSATNSNPAEAGSCVDAAGCLRFTSTAQAETGETETEQRERVLL